MKKKRTGPVSDFSASLIRWFRASARPLPWRETRDPYPIWLSEVILQQTRVAQGLGYYHRFLEAFPRLTDLAAAEQEDVLRIWQGLGYYSRARNLHQTAQILVRDYGGMFPSTYAGLLKLKGVGPYTAAALASFAFHEDVATVDGNVLRVFARWLGVEDDIARPATRKAIGREVSMRLPAGQSWLYNQAIMELGALVCTPRNPGCAVCPVADGCRARLTGRQSVLPVKSRQAVRRRRFLNYLLLEADGHYYFRPREGRDIWEGLFEPILLEAHHSFLSPEEFFAGLPDGSPAGEAHVFPVQRHILSHQELMVSLCLVRLPARPEMPSGRWVPVGKLKEVPLPVIFSKIIGKPNGRVLSLIF